MSERIAHQAARDDQRLARGRIFLAQALAHRMRMPRCRRRAASVHSRSFHNVHDAITRHPVGAKPSAGNQGRVVPMRAETSRIYEMGTRVDSYADTNPDTDQGNILSAAEGEGGGGADAAWWQRRSGPGCWHKRAGSAEKARLRREVLAGPVAHLAEVGKRAKRSEHELGVAFRYKPGRQTLRRVPDQRPEHAGGGGGQQGGAGAVSACRRRCWRSWASCWTSSTRRSGSANAGRTAHKGATKQLDELANELASVVRTMDARNRLRFEDNRQLLESWVSASTVLGVESGRRER